MTEKQDPVIEQLPECDRETVKFLIALLKSRLQASGKVEVQDEHGNVVCEDVCIFETKDMVNWIVQSLSAFNAHPPCTYYKLSDREFVSYFSDVLVGYAAYLACDAQALKEAGRPSSEAQSLSNHLQIKAQSELEAWKHKISTIKLSDNRFYEEWVKDPDEDDD